jgi:hypothetical protein
MAHLAPSVETPTWVDRSLDYLLAEWQAMPEIAAAWESWDEHDRLVFVVDWPVFDDRLNRLRATVERGVLTTEQWSRYRELERLVERYRPLLDRLLAE